MLVVCGWLLVVGCWLFVVVSIVVVSIVANKIWERTRNLIPTKLRPYSVVITNYLFPNSQLPITNYQ